MAILCRDLGLLFIQAPRTGCTAIEAVLRSRFGGERLPAEHLRDADGRVRVPAKHGTLRQLVAAGLVPADPNARGTSFVAVRNPFDSLVSLYAKQRESYQARLATTGTWIQRRPRYRESMALSVEHPFEAWLEHLYGRPDDERSRRGRRTLYSQFTDGVGTVIRYEQLQAGFTEVMRSVGVGDDVEIPPVNQTAGRTGTFRDQYTPRARAIVERAFHDELMRFSYQFDDEVPARSGAPTVPGAIDSA